MKEINKQPNSSTPLSCSLCDTIQEIQTIPARSGFATGDAGGQILRK